MIRYHREVDMETGTKPRLNERVRSFLGHTLSPEAAEYCTFSIAIEHPLTYADFIADLIDSREEAGVAFFPPLPGDYYDNLQQLMETLRAVSTAGEAVLPPQHRSALLCSPSLFLDIANFFNAYLNNHPDCADRLGLYAVYYNLQTISEQCRALAPDKPELRIVAKNVVTGDRGGHTRG